MNARNRDEWSAEQICSNDAFLAKFAEVLPKWLRRCGVRRADIADAVQEALLQICESRHKILTDADGPRQALIRIVSNVALRARRQAQRDAERYLSIESVEAPDPRDEAAWVEARVLVLLAIEKLDEPAQALIYAHEIEGRTNLEIAKALNEKEDTIERRVFVANKRLRGAVGRLVGGRKSVGSREALLLCGLGFDPFDKAIFGAVFETLGMTPQLSTILKFRPVSRPSIPTVALMGALVFAPISSEPITSSVPEAKRLSSVKLPELERAPLDAGKSLPPAASSKKDLQAGSRVEPAGATTVSKPLSRADHKAAPKSNAAPKSKEVLDPAIVNRMRGSETPGVAPITK
ncbi:MAG: sigma-70 family RNA polymerase sigma factor [Polyangiaceae bacterium]|nr:sigma-70 family RNA polymerase sigma factor [Polyangiaceae bacterium]